MALERGAQSELRALGPAALAERELAGEGEAVPARPEQAAARAEKAQGEGEYEEKCDCAALHSVLLCSAGTRAVSRYTYCETSESGELRRSANISPSSGS